MLETALTSHPLEWHCRFSETENQLDRRAATPQRAYCVLQRPNGRTVPAAALPWVGVWRLLGLLFVRGDKYSRGETEQDHGPQHAQGVAIVGGLALRWWAIVVLGRSFTVDVQIAPDHRLVESGPFRLVRHPSYTGVLLASFGFALSLCNWAALVIIMLPITAAFIRRMNVEEQALDAALGPTYADYIMRTKRLMPGFY